MSNLVVARYLDGKLLKGTSLDVDPTRPTFHVRPPEGEHRGGQAQGTQGALLRPLPGGRHGAP